MVSGCAHAPNACAGAGVSPNFAEYERKGFGGSAVWFSNAVVDMRWEGFSSIAPVEILGEDKDPMLSPVKLVTERAPDCPQNQRFMKQMERNPISLISGRGRLDDNGFFVISCVCSAKKLENLTVEQEQRLYAGSGPR